MDPLQSKLALLLHLNEFVLATQSSCTKSRTLSEADVAAASPIGDFCGDKEPGAILQNSCCSHEGGGDCQVPNKNSNGTQVTMVVGPWYKARQIHEQSQSRRPPVSETECPAMGASNVLPVP